MLACSASLVALHRNMYLCSPSQPCPPRFPSKLQPTPLPNSPCTETTWMLRGMRTKLDLHTCKGDTSGLISGCAGELARQNLWRWEQMRPWWLSLYSWGFQAAHNTTAFLPSSTFFQQNICNWHKILLYSTHSDKKSSSTAAGYWGTHMKGLGYWGQMYSTRGQYWFSGIIFFNFLLASREEKYSCRMNPAFYEWGKSRTLPKSFH